jgi:hypothetical protein
MTTLFKITTNLTAEERYLEQKMRDDNNSGCQAAANCRFRISRRSKYTAKDLEIEEQGNKKYRDDQIAGYGSIRYDFPEYIWWMVYDDGKRYYRSSNSWRVYDFMNCTKIVGMWNDEKKKIEFI